MTKIALPLMAVALLALVIASGCLFPETEALEAVKKHPAASDFLAENVNAVATVAVWSRQDSLNRQDYLVEKCGPSANITDYYYVTFTQEDNVLEAWVYQNSKAVSCVHRSDDECVTDSECDEGDLCTIDKCSGIPGKCSQTKVIECLGGDGCCPAGCTFSVDYDCPQGECVTNDQCDDQDTATLDRCVGNPKECVHTEITECSDGDGYCPMGCDFTEDSDCQRIECVLDEDCDDENPGTTDICSTAAGGETLCTYKKITECVGGDSYCPEGCERSIDGDCFVGVGDKERLIVSCQGKETSLNASLKKQDTRLVAAFDETVNNANNESLKSFEDKTYKYNMNSEYSSPMAEQLTIRGSAEYDKSLGKSFFSFNNGGLKYEVSMQNGIPATDAETNDKPFVSGYNDKVIIPLFGKDAFVTGVSIPDRQAEFVSNAVELAAGPGQTINLTGKNGDVLRARIIQCNENDSAFGLYKDAEITAIQTASTGSMLFESELKGTLYLSYLHYDTATGLCDFRYVTGTALETIKEGQEFNGFTPTLTFDGKRLAKITLTHGSIQEQGPMQSAESIEVLGSGSDTAKAFCTITFEGFFR